MTESNDTVTGEKITSVASIELLKKVNSAANYCYSCNKCNNVCPTALLDIFYPRSLITDLTFLTSEEALQNNDIWKCLTSGI